MSDGGGAAQPGATNRRQRHPPDGRSLQRDRSELSHRARAPAGRRRRTMIADASAVSGVSISPARSDTARTCAIVS
jgi:hypothetical protein